MQSLGKMHDRLITQLRAGLRDIGQGHTHVALAGRIENGIERGAQYLVERGNQFQDRDTALATDIIYPPSRFRRST